MVHKFGGIGDMVDMNEFGRRFWKLVTPAGGEIAFYADRVIVNPAGALAAQHEVEGENERS